ncbi:MAG: YeeE/YedE family protein [Deltaproteobacteria bacterium]|nr:YeeE/YedE family protein [Deltaproteobacteria bacterium]
MEYWPAWLGAIALGSIPVLVWSVERRLLGVSGSFGVLMAPRDRSAERLLADRKALEAEMVRATLEEFGPEAAAEVATAAPSLKAATRHLPRLTHLIFLTFIAVGGTLGAATSGGWDPSWSMGTTHAALFGTSTWASLGLLVGGIFVGFGTRLAGGCTSGHGLSGVPRMQVGSLIATASYFGAGALVSLGLARFLP